MAGLSEIELLMLHMKGHLQAWIDLVGAHTTSKEAKVFLKMKRGELIRRFTKDLNKLATRARGKAKAKGPFTPIPITTGEQMLLDFELGALYYQEGISALMDVKIMEATERLEGIVSETMPRLDEERDPIVAEMYLLFRGTG